MNRLFSLFILATVFCPACSDEDSYSKMDLSTLTMAVKDAKLIYKRSSSTSPNGVKATRSEDESGYWKVNFNGETKRIEFLDANGQAVDVEIRALEKLNEDLLFVEVAQTYPPISTSLLVESATGKVYKAPNDFQAPIQTDAAGMIYYRNHDSMIRKLDPTSFTVNDYLPAGQRGGFFLINKNAYCFYGSTFKGAENSGYIKCPGGAIVPDITNCFVDAEKSFYLANINGNRIIKMKELDGGKGIESGNYCTIPDAVGTVVQTIVNPVTKKTILFCNNGIADFDGSLIDGTSAGNASVEIRLVFDTEYEFFWEFYFNFKSYQGHYGYLSEWDKTFFSSNKLYYSYGYYSDETIHYEFDLTKYTLKEISIPDIMLYSISASPSSENLIVSGLQYSTGHVVIGEYSADGTLTITSETDNTNKIEHLICLN